MREIKFRGKTKGTGEWVFGYLYHNNTSAYILDGCWAAEVITETVGQYTGLKDKQGKEIYEGDIIKNVPGRRGCETSIIIYRDGAYRFLCSCGEEFKTPLYPSEYCEVIGNIHENRDLLEVK